jgi:hypothetical protein
MGSEPVETRRPATAPFPSVTAHGGNGGAVANCAVRRALMRSVTRGREPAGVRLAYRLYGIGSLPVVVRG